MNELAKGLILPGVVLALSAFILLFFQKVPFLGKLPGDILVKRENFTFSFPGHGHRREPPHQPHPLGDREAPLTEHMTMQDAEIKRSALLVAVWRRSSPLHGLVRETSRSRPWGVSSA